MLLHRVDCHCPCTRTCDPDSHCFDYEHAISDSQPDPGDPDRHSHEHTHPYLHSNIDSLAYRDLNAIPDADGFPDIYALLYAHMDSDPNNDVNADRHIDTLEHANANHHFVSCNSIK
jgi:hypothetical protein